MFFPILMKELYNGSEVEYSAIPIGGGIFSNILLKFSILYLWPIVSYENS